MMTRRVECIQLHRVQQLTSKLKESPKVPRSFPRAPHSGSNAITILPCQLLINFSAELICANRRSVKFVGPACFRKQSDRV